MSLLQKPFKRVRAFLDKPSAKEYNRIVSLLEKIARSNFSNGYVDSAGYHTRRTQPLPTPTIRRARTTAAAGAAATIVCSLYDSNGVEQTSGDEFEVTVYCTVTGSANLNEAIPALENDMDIFVTLQPYNTTTWRWYCVQIFQSMDNC